MGNEGEENRLKIILIVISLAIISMIILLLYIIINIIPSSAISNSILSNSNGQNILADNSTSTTLSPSGEGVTSLSATRHNQTWLEFDGVNDYVFIPDDSYKTISYWVNNTVNSWINVVNNSGILYEDGGVVGSLTLNSTKQNTTGWYIGINSTGFFKGNIDSIRFYNETITSTTINEVFDNGR